MAIKVSRNALIKAVTEYSMENGVDEHKIVKLLSKYKRRGITSQEDIQYNLHRPKFFFFKSDYQRLIPPELKVVYTLAQMTVSARNDEIWIQEYQYNIIKDYL